MGPEQATGGPDTPQAGDIPTAWASRAPDGQPEWLMLEYEATVGPTSVIVPASYHPGALRKVTAFRLDGEEVTLWSGTDPTSPGAGRGEWVIPIPADLKTQRIRLHLASPAVAGWNEIAAVSLVDHQGKTHWTTAAHGSSTYAEDPPTSPTNPAVDPQLLEGTLAPDRRTERGIGPTTGVAQPAIEPASSP